MKAELISWAAGILEGEGCFSLFYKTHKSGNTTPQFAIHCEMTDKDVIDNLKFIFGKGTINTRTNSKRLCKDGSKRKTTYIWSVQKQADVFDILLRLAPYMGVRRKAKIAEMLNLLEEKFI